MVTVGCWKKMKRTNENFHERLMLSVKDADEKQMVLILSERTAYIEGLTNKKEKKSALEYFLIKDKEVYGLVQKKKADVQNLLLDQSNQQKIINKYEQF